MRFEFEKIKSTIYPAYLHVGDYSISLEPELILSLKRLSDASPDAFMESLIQIVEVGQLAPRGGNRYLKEMMEAGAIVFEKPALSKRLCAEIKSL
jgi:hypothetical protein